MKKKFICFAVALLLGACSTAAEEASLAAPSSQTEDIVDMVHQVKVVSRSQETRIIEVAYHKKQLLSDSMCYLLTDEIKGISSVSLNDYAYGKILVEDASSLPQLHDGDVLKLEVADGVVSSDHIKQEVPETIFVSFVDQSLAITKDPLESVQVSEIADESRLATVTFRELVPLADNMCFLLVDYDKDLVASIQEETEYAVLLASDADAIPSLAEGDVIDVEISDAVINSKDFQDYPVCLIRELMDMKSPGFHPGLF